MFSKQFYTICAFLVITVYAASVKAMDWETASEIAFCRHSLGYEEKAMRALESLKAHQIYGKVMYFKRINGVDAITEDTSEADKFGIFVDVKNADAARKVLGEEVKKGLGITLSPTGR